MQTAAQHEVVKISQYGAYKTAEKARDRNKENIENTRSTHTTTAKRERERNAQQNWRKKKRDGKLREASEGESCVRN